MIILVIDIIYVLQHQGKKYKAKREQKQLTQFSPQSSTRGNSNILTTRYLVY